MGRIRPPGLSLPMPSFGLYCVTEVVRCVYGLTFDIGLKVRVLVQFVHLLFPVKVVSPVRDHLFQILRVEAIKKLAVLQRSNGPCLVYSSVKVLGKKSKDFFFFF